MKKMAMAALAAWALGTLPGLAGSDEVAGYLGDQPITVQEIDDLIARELNAIRQQEFDLRSRGLEQIVNQRLLEKEAKARGISVEELMKIEVEDKLAQPTDEAVSQFFETNKARMGGRTLEQVGPDIRNYLLQQERGRLGNQLIEGLRGDVQVRVLLDPPRIDVPVPDGAPSRGPADASVTVVEFSDFQCPYCRRAHPTVERMLEEYGDRIRFVYRDYPLPIHPRATPASKAARCAGEQDRYWDYHENLMTVTGDLSDADLKQRAAQMELDVEAFDACYASDRHEAAVQAGLEDGAQAGVNGTPAFFINGRLVSGAQPFDVFRKVLDDELARAAASEPATD